MGYGDESGEWIGAKCPHTRRYNTGDLRNAGATELLPVKTALTIREPYFKWSQDGGGAIRVDDPAALVLQAPSQAAEALYKSGSEASLAKGAHALRVRALFGGGHNKSLVTLMLGCR